jgi:hypothetical protein
MARDGCRKHVCTKLLVANSILRIFYPANAGCSYREAPKLQRFKLVTFRSILLIMLT